MIIECTLESKKAKECRASLTFSDLTMKEYVDFMSFHEETSFFEFIGWMIKALEGDEGMSSDSTLTP